MQSHHPSEGLTLRDIIYVVKKHKLIVLLVIVIIVILGLASMKLVKPTYLYKQAIISASYDVNGQQVFLEPAYFIAARVEGIYLPQFMANTTDYPQHFSANAELQLVNVSSNNGLQLTINAAMGGIFYLSVVTTQPDAIFFPKLSMAILQSIRDSQNAQIENLRQNISQKIAIINTQLQQQVGIPVTKQNSEAALIELRLQAVTLQSQLNSLKPADFLGQAVVSPVMKLSKVIVLTISLLIGCLLGIFLAFIVETWQH